MRILFGMRHTCFGTYFSWASWRVGDSYLKRGWSHLPTFRFFEILMSGPTWPNHQADVSQEPPKTSILGRVSPSTFGIANPGSSRVDEFGSSPRKKWYFAHLCSAGTLNILQAKPTFGGTNHGLLMFTTYMIIHIYIYTCINLYMIPSAKPWKFGDMIAQADRLLSVDLGYVDSWIAKGTKSPVVTMKSWGFRPRVAESLAQRIWIAPPFSGFINFQQPHRHTQIYIYICV